MLHITAHCTMRAIGGRAIKAVHCFLSPSDWCRLYLVILFHWQLITLCENQKYRWHRAERCAFTSNQHHRCIKEEYKKVLQCETSSFWTDCDLKSTRKVPAFSSIDLHLESEKKTTTVKESSQTPKYLSNELQRSRREAARQRYTEMTGKGMMTHCVGVLVVSELH